MLLGYARSASPNAYLLPEHPIYEYSGGFFRTYSPDTINVTISSTLP